MDNVNVIYTPGNEPENIKKRLDTLFAKLEGAYPDKIIYALHKDHKKWGETVTELYRLLGYKSGNDFLVAYGFTVAENKGGRPKNDSSFVIEELKRRYPNGTSKKLGEIQDENPDISGQITSLRCELSKKGEITFKDLLIKEGIIVGKIVSMADAEKEIETLREKYKETPFVGTFDNLKNENSELDWKAIDKYCISRGMRTLPYLKSIGVFADVALNDKISLDEIERELKEKYSQTNNYPRNLSEFLRENENISESKLKRLVQSVYKETSVEYLKRIGIIVDEKTAYRKRLDAVMPILRERYAGKADKPITVASLIKENKDLDITALSLWIKVGLEKIPEKYLVDEGLVASIEERMAYEEEAKLRRRLEAERQQQKEIDEEVKKLEEIKIKKTVPYKNSNEYCSVEELREILADYIAIWCFVRRLTRGPMSTFYQIAYAPSELKRSEKADEIVTRLDEDKLSDFLEDLVATESKNYRPFTLCWATYASGESVARMASRISSCKRGKSKEKYWYENMFNSLYFSDTKEAFEYIERNGDAERYARLRGMTLQDYRDAHSIPDFGFDSTGVKKYNVDGNEIEVRVANNFVLILTDTKTGKIVKSISKKTADGIKAAEDLATLKKNLDEFYKHRIEYVKKTYITGEKISEQNWNNTYMKNPLFRPLVESLIWQDDNGMMFDISQGVCRDVAGMEYTPVGAVRIAHVLDMTGEQIDSWQKRIVTIMKPLLIEQVWEPVFSGDTNKISSSRYSDTEWTSSERNEFKKALKQKGIEVKSAEREAEFDHRRYEYVFDPNGTMLIGKIARLNYVVDENTKNLTLGAISFVGGSAREKNAVVFELDKRSIKALIKNDLAQSISVELLDSFTLAQINEFVDLSIKCESNNCTALLLEHKNSKYEAFDPFDMFVLD